MLFVFCANTIASFYWIWLELLFIVKKKVYFVIIFFFLIAFPIPTISNHTRALTSYSYHCNEVGLLDILLLHHLIFLMQTLCRELLINPKLHVENLFEKYLIWISIWFYQSQILRFDFHWFFFNNWFSFVKNKSCLKASFFYQHSFNL